MQDLTAEDDLLPLPSWAPGARRPAGARTRPAPPPRAPRRPSASCDAPPRKRAGGPSGETGLNMIGRDRDVAPQERVRERLRDVRQALACAFTAN